MTESGDRLARYFLAHRAVTQELAARIPDDRVDYAPWPGAMGVGRLLVHMANSHHALAATPPIACAPARLYPRRCRAQGCRAQR